MLFESRAFKPKTQVINLCLCSIFKCILLSFSLFASEPCFRNNPLLYDLEMADYFDRKLEERFPLSFTHILTTGYFTTPSARMGEEGELSFGVGSVPPYTNWNLRFQLFNCLELSGNYRIFRGVCDSTLSQHGFGHYADRGANIKWGLITPEESYYDLPGLAIGIEDFMGSKKFTNYFAVLTKVWPTYGLETTLGWGSGRYTRGPSRGFFAAASYFPFWDCDYGFLKGAGLALEYDPIDYTNPKREPNPHGRVTRTPINVGAKYKFGTLIDLSASYIRGQSFAVSGSLNYNLGQMEGFLPKIKDSPFYTSPRDTQALGCYRNSSLMIQNLAYVLERQGFRLIRGVVDGETLWISVINKCYRREFLARKRLENILASLTPSNLAFVVVVFESHGMPCQQYVYPRELLERYASCDIGESEFTILTPQMDFRPLDIGKLVYYNRLDLWRMRLSPRLETFWGSAKGKFKYDLGLKADFEGFFPYDIFYELQLSYTALSTTNDVSDFDLFSPSQLPCVLTDYVNYRKARIFSTDKAYLQKNWNLTRGWFSKLAGGYFQVNYAGIEGELLWYPANNYVAVGIEGALLKKRRYTGLGFQSKLRKLDGLTPTYIPYTVLTQYFLNLYFDIPEAAISTKLSAGGFLAWDKGVRFEITRYFRSGLRVTGWLTFTDANDRIHNENYYNRGIAIELPLDIFFRCSSRRVWNYGMAAWLRDAGATTTAGKSLFEIVNLERRP